jgi:hypothetical protein
LNATAHVDRGRRLLVGTERGGEHLGQVEGAAARLLFDLGAATEPVGDDERAG